MRRAPLALLFLAMALSGEGAGAPSPAAFSRVPVRGELVTYYDFAVWAPGEELLLVNHPRAGQLVPLQRDGQLQKPLQPFPWEGGNPMFAHAMGYDEKGPFVLYRDAFFHTVRELRFDAQGRIVSNESWERRFDGSQVQLACPRHTPVRFAGEVFCFATVRESETKVRQGLVRYPETPGARLTFLREHQGNSVERAMAWDFPLLAATSQGVFLLDFSTEPPSVLQLAPASRRLASFPPGFQRPPEIPPGLGGPDAAEAFQEGLEATPVPLGLFSAAGKLLILTRTPLGKDRARWELHRLDPAQDRLEGVLELPTTAPKVLLVPGSKRWAFLELGPAGPPVGARKLLGLLEAPAATLAAPWPAAPGAGSKQQGAAKKP